MYGAPILPIWKLIHSHTRSLRPWDSLPPVSPPFWRHIAESDFLIFANHISRDHISDLWTGIFSVGSPNTTFHCHCFTLTFTFSISFSDVFQYNMSKINNSKAMLFRPCLVRFLFRLNVLLQSLHWKVFSPMCDIVCFCSSPAETKMLPHWPHLYGFSPVCTLLMRLVILPVHYRLSSIKGVRFRFANFASHFIRVQIFQIDFSLILSTSKFSSHFIFVEDKMNTSQSTR